MDFKISPVALDRIDTADRTFKVTTHTDKIDLAPSIDSMGLLQPVVLLEKGDDYTVVCGFRRIRICAGLAIGPIAARILPADFPALACARFAIADNAFQRQLNVVEQSRAFALIRRFAEDSNAWPSIAQSTGLPDSRRAMDRIMPVAGMPPSLQKAILNGSIALPVALQINDMQKEDAVALGDLLGAITAGLNVQRELLAMVGDISRRDDISIAKLIDDGAIKAIMDDTDTPAPQKVKQLRMLLKFRRYPELSQAEATYKQALNSLRLDRRIQLQAPPFFEGTSYRLTLSIDSRRQLKSLQPQLDKLAHHPDLLPE